MMRQTERCQRPFLVPLSLRVAFAHSRSCTSRYRCSMRPVLKEEERRMMPWTW